MGLFGKSTKEREKEYMTARSHRLLLTKPQV